MKSPAKYGEINFIKIVVYTNNNAVTVTSGSYSAITLTKKTPTDDTTGYTFIGIADAYAGNLRLPITRFGSGFIYVMNPTNSSQTINANDIEVKQVFIKDVM